MDSRMTIKIKNLRLRTIVGIFPEERENLQDVIINADLLLETAAAVHSDRIDDTLDYKTLAKKIIQHVENSQFFLLEKLTRSVLDLILEDPRVEWACVEIDKPNALRFADSVSCKAEANRP